MGAFFSYTVLASVLISLLYPVLCQIVNRSRFFRFNRGALICGMVLSLAVAYLFEANDLPSTSALPVVNGLESKIHPQFIETAAADPAQYNN